MPSHLPSDEQIMTKRDRQSLDNTIILKSRLPYEDIASSFQFLLPRCLGIAVSIISNENAIVKPFGKGSLPSQS